VTFAWQKDAIPCWGSRPDTQHVQLACDITEGEIGPGHSRILPLFGPPRGRCRDPARGGLLHIAHLLTANGQHRVERPPEASFDDVAADELADVTQTDATDWVFPIRDGVEVRSGDRQDAAMIETLGLYLVRVIPDDSPANAVLSVIKVLTPSGKVGFVGGNHIPPHIHRAHRDARPSQRFRWIQKKLAAIRSASAARSLFCAISASSLRKASKLGSLTTFGRVIGTG
jgi:hypothetical protein